MRFTSSTRPRRSERPSSWWTASTRPGDRAASCTRPMTSSIRFSPTAPATRSSRPGSIDSSPSGAPGVTAFVRTQGGDDDVWLIVDGETINVTASDADAGEPAPRPLLRVRRAVDADRRRPHARGHRRNHRELPDELRPEPELRRRHDQGIPDRWLPAHEHARGRASRSHRIPSRRWPPPTARRSARRI